MVCVLALVAGGVGYLSSAAWWPAAVIGGAGLSALLMALVFSPWWLGALAIDVGLIIWTLVVR